MRPVPTVPVPRPCVQFQRRIPDARELTRHVFVHMPVASAPPHALAHASALTPVRARETARVGSDTILNLRYPPIPIFQFGIFILNLGPRFLLGGRIVTPQVLITYN